MRHRIRCTLQHWLNPLHVFCRLKDAGVSAAWAGYLAMIYERAIYRNLGLV